MNKHETLVCKDEEEMLWKKVDALSVECREMRSSVDVFGWSSESVKPLSPPSRSLPGVAGETHIQLADTGELEHRQRSRLPQHCCTYI